MSLLVTIEFSSDADFATTKARGDKVKMIQQRLQELAKEDRLKVKVKRVLERNKFDVTVGEDLVYSQARDGQIDPEKLKKIIAVVSNELK